MIKQVILILFLLASGLTLSVSEFNSDSLNPHAAENFKLNYIQLKDVGNCSYTVIISTSCSSPRFTTDKISIAFGDAFGNQIFEPKLDDPSSGTFGQCSSDTFQINGPCAQQICYAYLYRSGSAGWKPESVKIGGSASKPVTFYFDTFIPNDTWYGFDLCSYPPSPPPAPLSPPPPSPAHPSPPPPPPAHPSPPPPSPPPPSPPPPSSSYQVSTQKWLILMVLGFVLGFWL